MNRARTIIVGSAESCHLVIDGDPAVSPRHCTISCDSEGAVWIGDLGSMNGTWIGTPSGWAHLGAGELFPFLPGYILRIGHTSFPWKETARAR